MFDNSVTHHFVLRKLINAELIYKTLRSKINLYFFVSVICWCDGNRLLILIRHINFMYF